MKFKQARAQSESNYDSLEVAKSLGSSCLRKAEGQIFRTWSRTLNRIRSPRLAACGPQSEKGGKGNWQRASVSSGKILALRIGCRVRLKICVNLVLGASRNCESMANRSFGSEQKSTRGDKKKSTRMIGSWRQSCVPVIRTSGCQPIAGSWGRWDQTNHTETVENLCVASQNFFSKIPWKFFWLKCVYLFRCCVFDF